MDAQFKIVDTAAQALNSSFGIKDWLLGVGVGKHNGAFTIEVRVTSAMPANSIPNSYNGIPVRIETIDMPVAQ